MISFTDATAGVTTIPEVIHVTAPPPPASVVPSPSGSDWPTADLPSWYLETTKESKNDAEIKRRLQNLASRQEELRKLMTISGNYIFHGTGKPEDSPIVEGLSLPQGITRDISRELDLISHAKGDLLFNLRMNERIREIDPVRAYVEQKIGENWNDLSESAKSYWRMKIGHPEWQVRPNLFTT